ncbi:MAG: hypothetical protein QOH24_1646 [Verrucomicrobiota bacterium]
MSDFSDLERELRKLQPIKPSAGLLHRIEQGLADRTESPSNIITPKRFSINWLGLGLGLAAAAAFVILARIDFRPRANTEPQIASATPALRQNAMAAPNFVPAGLTRVVYSSQDEGLIFTPGQELPSRRVRTAERETLQWRDPQSGASLRVSYPTEEVTLTPVSGQ